MFFTLAGRTKFLILLSVLTAVVALLFAATFWGVHFIYDNWKSLADARRELKVLEQRRESVSSALHLLTDLDDERLTIESSFSDPANPLRFFEGVENLGRRLGVKVELRQASAAVTDQYIVTADGTFRQVFSFLRSLETMPFLMSSGDAEINAVSFIQGVGKQTVLEPLVELRITIRTIKP